MKQIENSAKNAKKSKIFWRYFWITIVVMAAIFIALNVTASKKLNEMSSAKREAKLGLILKDFKQKFPEFVKMTEALNEQSVKQIQQSINQEIEIAYSPLYGQIDNLSDFHFSVTGEYSELMTIIFGNIDTILNDKIFRPVKFDEKLDKALNNINNESLLIVQKQLNQMKSQIKNDINLNSDEIDFLFTNMLKLTQEDMKTRFKSYSNNLFKGMGLGVGVGAGALMAKIISKKISKVVATKIATKVAIKGGAKLAGAGAGVLAGSSTGLLCGPVAWLCSPAAAVVGGIVGWFATDKIVVEIDQYYNEEEFKSEIKNLIDQQKESTKRSINKIYTVSFNRLLDKSKDKLESIKSREIIDIIEIKH